MVEISVFLRSILLTGQLTSWHYSYDYHYFMEKHFREHYHWLRDQGFTKGQVFEPDCAALLPLLAQLAEIKEVCIHYYDFNTLKGKIHGWRFGIRKTPSILIRGKILFGKETVLESLKAVIENPLAFG